MSQPTIDIQSIEKAHWSEQDKSNVKSVLDFVQLIMNEHNFDQVSKMFSGKPYVQHNRTMSDDIEGVLAALKDLTKRSPEFSYDVKHVFVDGDHVIVHSHATLFAKHRGDDTKGLNIIDTWKVVDGQPAEHWDAVQGLDVSMRLYGLFMGGKVKNGNGVF